MKQCFSFARLFYDAWQAYRDSADLGLNWFKLNKI